MKKASRRGTKAQGLKKGDCHYLMSDGWGVCGKSIKKRLAPIDTIQMYSISFPKNMIYVIKSTENLAKIEAYSMPVQYRGGG